MDFGVHLPIPGLTDQDFSLARLVESEQKLTKLDHAGDQFVFLWPVGDEIEQLE